MTTDKVDPLLDSARRERARRWFHTDLRGYPTLRAEAETAATLAAEPKAEQVRKGEGRAGREMTTDGLDAFITNLAAHVAHTTKLPRDQAEQFVADLVERARAEYAAAGAAYGDDDVGFLCWLSERVAARVAREG